MRNLGCYKYSTAVCVGINSEADETRMRTHGRTLLRLLPAMIEDGVAVTNQNPLPLRC